MDVARHLEVSHCVFGLPISRMWNDSTFKIRKVSEITDSCRNMIIIEYDYIPSKVVLRSGWLLVSPEDNWALQQYESNTRLGTVVSGKVVYGKKWRGMALPSRSFVKIGAKSTGTRSHPKSGCTLNRRTRNPRHFWENRHPVLNDSCDAASITAVGIHSKTHEEFSRTSTGSQDRPEFKVILVRACILNICFWGVNGYRDADAITLDEAERNAI